jgi:hypothetical protein
MMHFRDFAHAPHTLASRLQPLTRPVGTLAAGICAVGSMTGRTPSWQTNANSMILSPTTANVGIGTTSPQYRLSVNGTIGTKDVIVTNTGWSDYVFGPGYRLRPLSEVSAYVQANHHLSGIPTEAEVLEKGVSLGGMQFKLLAKIKELTLHMIQADQGNARLDRENQESRQQNRELSERLACLVALVKLNGRRQQ